MGQQDLSELNKTLGEMIARAANPTPALNEIGQMMVGEMKKNIQVGGRPSSWPQSIRARVKGGETLRDSGTLMNSMRFATGASSVAAGPTAVGREKKSDPRIFGILAFGGTIKAKNKPFLRFRVPGLGFVSKKEVTIPGRDFTFMPEDAQRTFGEIVQQYVNG